MLPEVKHFLASLSLSLLFSFLLNFFVFFASLYSQHTHTHIHIHISVNKASFFSLSLSQNGFIFTTKEGKKKGVRENMKSETPEAMHLFFLHKFFFHSCC